MNTVICISGCTATGKSRVAKELAEIRPAVIINADSIQVYRCMAILSSRPTSKDFGGLENSLYGHIECGVDYSVGKWLEDVEVAIRNAHRKEKTPIIVGGTGLYFSALLNGLSFIPPVSKKTRQNSEYLRKTSPKTLLHDLKVNDNETYINIDQQNIVRVQRAWEVLIDTGYGLSYWQKQKSVPILGKYNNRNFIISCDQSILQENISNRSREMFEQKVDIEVKQILDSNFHASFYHPAHKAIGFFEVCEYLRGNITLEQAIDSIVIKTRQYAKKQRTWFRNQMSEWQVIKITKDFNLTKASQLIDKSVFT